MNTGRFVEVSKGLHYISKDHCLVVSITGPHTPFISSSVLLRAKQLSGSEFGQPSTSHFANVTAYNVKSLPVIIAGTGMTRFAK